MADISPRTNDARRCTNPECEFGNRRIVGRMVVLKNGKLLCRRQGCPTIYEPREVIDSDNETVGSTR